jgi:hypothetical protein
VKAVESSTVVAFRALVMLACLIVVPLAAIFGSAFPDIVRSTLIDPLLGHKTTPAASGANAPAASPLDGSSGPQSSLLAGGGLAPAWQDTNRQASTPPSVTSFPGVPESPAVNVPGMPNGQLQSAALPAQPGVQIGQGSQARFDAPAAAAPAWGASPDGQQTNLAGRSASVAPQSSMAPVFPRAAADLPTTQGVAQAVGGAPAQAAPQADNFTRLERRLRSYGAIYYLLETWGNEGELYRFHCKMAIANNPNHTRHFEATHPDALQAMTQVLEQIEAWRTSRAPDRLMAAPGG